MLLKLQIMWIFFLNIAFGIRTCRGPKLEVYHMKLEWGHPLIWLLSCFMYSLLFISCFWSFCTLLHFFSIHWNSLEGDTLSLFRLNFISYAVFSSILNILCKNFIFSYICSWFLPFLQGTSVSHVCCIHYT